MVGLVEVGLGGGDACGPFGVVGQKEEAPAGFVEASDGPEPIGSGSRAMLWRIRGRQAVVNRGAAMFVFGGGDQAARFVEDQVTLRRGLDGVAGDFDLVFAEMDGGLRIAANCSIQLDLASSDELGG